VLDAFGIYSNYRKANNLWVTIGAEGFVSPSQLMFYQDRYFVRLQVAGATSLEKDIFLACARAISGNIPAGSGQPKELEVMKIPALVPKSERYLAQSLLGYVFFRRGIIADAIVKDEKMQIFVIHEDTQAAARKTFGSIPFLSSGRRAGHSNDRESGLHASNRRRSFVWRSVSRAVGTLYHRCSQD